MALTIKNLGFGTLGNSGETPIVATVAAGKSVLVENVIFYNKASSCSISVYLYRDVYSGSVYVLRDQTLAANARFVLEAITLSPGARIWGVATAAATIDFLANGVEKDL